MSGQRNRQGTRTAGLKARAAIAPMSVKREQRLRSQGRYRPGSTFACPDRKPATAPGASAIWRRVGSGLKAFPRKVLALLRERDPWCQRCGSPGPLHSHHRRAKGIGGDARPHSQCACNGVRLCCFDRDTGELGGCHLWVHLHPEQARAEGWIVSQEIDEPGRVSVMRGSEDGGAAMFPTCDGQWADFEPEAGECAA